MSIAGPRKRGIAVVDVTSNAPFDVTGVCGITLGSCHNGKKNRLLAGNTNVLRGRLGSHVVFSASGSLHCCLVGCVRGGNALSPHTLGR